MSIQWPPYSGGQILMGAEDNSFVKGLEGDGVIIGLTLSAAGTDMDVDVASGQAIVGGSLQNNAGGAVTLSNGDATNPRFDLIWINSSNTLGKTEGTPAANPVMPDYPANVVILGVAYVQATVTTISTSDLRYRARVELDTNWRNTSDYTKVDAAKVTGQFTEVDVSSSGRIRAGTYGRPFKFLIPCAMALWTNESSYIQLEYFPNNDNFYHAGTASTAYLNIGFPLSGLIRNFSGSSSNRARITEIKLAFRNASSVTLKMYIRKSTLTASTADVVGEVEAGVGTGYLTYSTPFTLDADAKYWVFIYKTGTENVAMRVQGMEITGYEEL